MLLSVRQAVRMKLTVTVDDVATVQEAKGICSWLRALVQTAA
jgi:hypothetical protein